MPLGSHQKGCIDIVGATVEVRENSGRSSQRLDWLLQIRSPSLLSPLKAATFTKDEAEEWAKSIQDVTKSANTLVSCKTKSYRCLENLKN